MPPALRARLTFANVTSVIALFVALGGTKNSDSDPPDMLAGRAGS